MNITTTGVKDVNLTIVSYEMTQTIMVSHGFNQSIKYSKAAIYSFSFTDIDYTDATTEAIVSS